MVDEKRKTSRISLEAALAPQGGASSSSGPKTIKIKKPSEAPTLKAAVKDSTKTAQLDDVADAAAKPATPSGRKTIKVKRPTQRPGVKGVTVKRPAGAPGVAVAKPVVAGAGAPVAVQGIQQLAPAKIGAFWPVTALLNLIVILVTIYMLCSQALGPDFSLTQLSYGLKKDIDLPWPGKLQMMNNNF